MSKCNNLSEVLLERARLACGDFDSEALEFLEAMYADVPEMESKNDYRSEMEGECLREVQETFTSEMESGSRLIDDIRRALRKVDERIDEITEAFLDNTLEPGHVSHFKQLGKATYVSFGWWYDFSLVDEIANACSILKNQAVEAEEFTSLCYQKSNISIYLCSKEHRYVDNCDLLQWANMTLSCRDSGGVVKLMRTSSGTYLRYETTAKGNAMSRIKQSGIDVGRSSEHSAEYCIKEIY